MTQAPLDDSPLAARARRFFGSPWLYVAIIAAVMAFNVGRAVTAKLPPPLPVLGTLPSFHLTDQAGAAFGSDNLAGKAWVANFIFTRCPTVCPAFTEKMADIQSHARGLGTSFHLVSFSVDPEHDTPPVLMEYTHKFRVNPRAWSFVTGPLDQVKGTVVDGLKVSMGNDSPDGNFEGIFHGSHFVLVDGRGRIRGYYDSNDEDSVERVVHDAGWLLSLGT